ncbi:MAG: TauD/TfdA family dioxygenase [Rhodospirillaceae bacterium]|jgi:alpha-ketoglutarate-dependent 2,4-dichlorophenoxyacetate dioxygenase|nr:TauD/TfdA family dioxygenase [Rhodospirillaceae bacterium]MBT5812725.1 TauD/TfdA family dioxygenase [Rhodospirillaceae bacterium]
MKIEPINTDFAATVSDVDLSQPLPDDIVAGIEQAMDRYAVLVFHDQPMTDDQHAAFTRRFGPIDKGLLLGSKRKQRLTNAEVIDLANVDPDGAVLPASHIRNVSLIANQFWHSDSSFKNPPAKYSILCGMDLPAQGGQTEFADQRAAYDALSDDMKARIDGMVAEHWAYHSRNMLGGGGYSDAEMAALPPVFWPMAHTIPGSDRKSLFIGIHTREIDGMETAEARMLLHDLLEHATQRQFVYRHEWRANDVLMWDNQSTLHRGRAYDLSKLRELRRCTTEVVMSDAG